MSVGAQEPARILVVDDSSVVRTVIRKAIDRVPELTVMGTAANGLIAMDKVRADKPDAITLDIEMPEADGLTTLKMLKEEFPTIPVLMVSTLTQRGAEVTVEALLLGASGYVHKPSFSAGRQEARDAFSAALVPKLLAVTGRAAHQPAAGSAPEKKSIRPSPKRVSVAPGTPPKILAIGSSTGGPAALLDLLGSLPARFSLPIVIAQHMPPTFTERLAKRLSDKTHFEVKEGFDGATPTVGTAWIAPGGSHMVLTENLDGGLQIGLNQDPPEQSCRPAVDVLFRSVAASCGAASIAVVLTGMGQDGLAGSKRIREQGGRILAQDEASSVVWGMPGFVARDGVAHEVVPLQDMASTITRYVGPAGLATRSERRNVG